MTRNINATYAWLKAKGLMVKTERLNVRGTDIGPACWRCKGTIWTYYQVSDGYPEASRKWHAECCGCHVPEGPIAAGGSSATAMDIRKAHEHRGKTEDAALDRLTGASHAYGEQTFVVNATGKVEIL